MSSESQVFDNLPPLKTAAVRRKGLKFETETFET